MRASDERRKKRLKEKEEEGREMNYGGEEREWDVKDEINVRNIRKRS